MEDSAESYRPFSHTSENRDRKVRYVIVSVYNNGRVRLHKSRENANGTFSIGKTWPLEELRHIEEFESQGFLIVMQKPYFWMTDTRNERDAFISALLRIFYKYTNGRLPEVKGFSHLTDSVVPLPPISSPSNSNYTRTVSYEQRMGQIRSMPPSNSREELLSPSDPSFERNASPLYSPASNSSHSLPRSISTTSNKAVSQNRHLPEPLDPRIERRPSDYSLTSFEETSKRSIDDFQSRSLERVITGDSLGRESAGRESAGRESPMRRLRENANASPTDTKSVSSVGYKEQSTQMKEEIGSPKPEGYHNAKNSPLGAKSPRNWARGRPPITLAAPPPSINARFLCSLDWRNPSALDTATHRMLDDPALVNVADSLSGGGDVDKEMKVVTDKLEIAIKECATLDSMLTIYAAEMSIVADDVEFIKSHSGKFVTQLHNKKALRSAIQDILSE